MFLQVTTPFSSAIAVSQNFFFLNSHMAWAVLGISWDPLRSNSLLQRKTHSLESVNKIGMYFLYLP